LRGNLLFVNASKLADIGCLAAGFLRMIGSDGKTAFVFTGGGSLGAIQVGMLRALHAAQVHPDLVVGASVGAINAGYFACFPTAEGVANLGDNLDRSPPLGYFPLNAG
jgi:predicted acylesterase/phospholipase RssA